MLLPNNTTGIIDNLTYYYNGNKLIGVNDAVTTNNQGDFIDNVFGLAAGGNLEAPTFNLPQM